jgi:hypothetical protein
MRTTNTLILNSLLLIKKTVPYLIGAVLLYSALWFIAFLGNIEGGL